MSYILDALRKLEEKEGRSEGSGKRLGGGNRPAGRPPRGKTVYVLAAAATLAAVVAVVLTGGGDGGLPVEGIEPGPGVQAGADAPKTTAKTAAGGRAPGEKKNSETAAAEMATGDGTAQRPVARPAAAPARTVVEIESAGQPPANEAAEEVSFEEVFGDLGIEEPPEAPPVATAGDTWAAAGTGEPRREDGGATASPAASASPEPGRTYHYEELPEAVKAELGEMNITGHIYSEDAAYRLLMIGDGVRKEGDTISPGLVLKEITAAGARFTYGGFTFLVEAF